MIDLEKKTEDICLICCFYHEVQDSAMFSLRTNRLQFTISTSNNTIVLEKFIFHCLNWCFSIPSKSLDNP